MFYSIVELGDLLVDVVVWNLSENSKLFKDVEIIPVFNYSLSIHCQCAVRTLPTSATDVVQAARRTGLDDLLFVFRIVEFLGSSPLITIL